MENKNEDSFETLQRAIANDSKEYIEKIKSQIRTNRVIRWIIFIIVSGIVFFIFLHTCFPIENSSDLTFDKNVTNLVESIFLSLLIGIFSLILTFKLSSNVFKTHSKLKECGQKSMADVIINALYLFCLNKMRNKEEDMAYKIASIIRQKVNEYVKPKLLIKFNKESKFDLFLDFDWKSYSQPFELRLPDSSEKFLIKRIYFYSEEKYLTHFGFYPIKIEFFKNEGVQHGIPLNPKAFEKESEIIPVYPDKMI
jgi:predicted CopG family antitoxin